MDTPDPKHDVTQLLANWRSGDAKAAEDLIPLVYDKLRRLAARLMSGERSAHTLQATALVNEAYMQLVGADIPFQDRAHFFAVAARTMRRVLVDHARGKNRQKRGGDVDIIALEENMVGAPGPDAGVTVLDEALSTLEAQDERKAKVLELHYFGGLTYDEIAAALDISKATIHRELRMGKAWLKRELQPAD